AITGSSVGELDTWEGCLNPTHPTVNRADRIVYSLSRFCNSFPDPVILGDSCRRVIHAAWRGAYNFNPTTLMRNGRNSPEFRQAPIVIGFLANSATAAAGSCGRMRNGNCIEQREQGARRQWARMSFADFSRRA